MFGHRVCTFCLRMGHKANMTRGAKKPGIGHYWWHPVCRSSSEHVDKLQQSHIVCANCGLMGHAENMMPEYRSVGHGTNKVLVRVHKRCPLLRKAKRG